MSKEGGQKSGQQQISTRKHGDTTKKGVRPGRPLGKDIPGSRGQRVAATNEPWIKVFENNCQGRYPWKRRAGAKGWGDAEGGPRNRRKQWGAGETQKSRKKRENKPHLQPIGSQPHRMRKWKKVELERSKGGEERPNLWNRPTKKNEFCLALSIRDLLRKMEASTCRRQGGGKDERWGKSCYGYSPAAVPVREARKGSRSLFNLFSRSVVQLNRESLKTLAVP